MKKVALKLISIPRDFYTLHTVSYYDLLQQAGGAKITDEISEHDLLEALSQKPEFVSDWMQYSDDQRTDKAWYFKKENNKYVVEWYDDSDDPWTMSPAKYEFVDRLEACSKYIKKELDLAKQLWGAT